MSIRWFFTGLVIAAMSVPVGPWLTGGADGAAHAEGGRGPKDAPGQTRAKKSKPTTAVPKPVLAAKPDKPFVPDTAISRNDSVDYIQKDLQTQARRDNLRGMATSLKRVSALRAHIDTAFIATQGSRDRNEPNRIYQQLTAYRNQKQNKELAYFASGLLSAIAAERALAQATGLQAEYRAAGKAGQDVKAALIKGDYEDARAEYYRKVRRVPEAIRGMFHALPEDPAK